MVHLRFVSKVLYQILAKEIKVSWNYIFFTCQPYVRFCVHVSFVYHEFDLDTMLHYLIFTWMIKAKRCIIYMKAIKNKNVDFLLKQFIFYHSFHINNDIYNFFLTDPLCTFTTEVS